jgi:hypothetical protein
MVFVVSAALVFVRQYGMIVPAGMTLACFFLNKNRRRYVLIGVVCTAIIYLSLQWYESYLRTVLPYNACYKFSGMINPTRRLFWDYLWYGLSTRYKIVAIHVLFYGFPFYVIFVPWLFKQFRVVTLTVMSLIVFAVVYYLYLDYPLQVGNVFLDTSVGTDTSYETLKGTYQGVPHFYSRLFEQIVTPFKYLLITVGSIFLLLSGYVLWKKIRDGFRFPVEFIFLFILFVAYLVMILITESFFDRYQIPVIGISILLFSFAARAYSEKPVFSVIPLLLLFYISVFGTRDYFTWNDVKWKAYYDVAKEENVDVSRIHGGFESINWNENRPSIWYDFELLYKYDYLIQFQKEDSFTVFKELPFQRFFPLKKDTMRVFKRNVFAAGKAGQLKDK